MSSRACVQSANNTLRQKSRSVSLYTLSVINLRWIAINLLQWLPSIFFAVVAKHRAEIVRTLNDDVRSLGEMV